MCQVWGSWANATLRKLQDLKTDAIQQSTRFQKKEDAPYYTTKFALKLDKVQSTVEAQIHKLSKMKALSPVDADYSAQKYTSFMTEMNKFVSEMLKPESELALSKKMMAI